MAPAPAPAARRELHLPKPAHDDAFDEKAVKRASRLSVAAGAVDSLDIKAIAETYKRTEGASELEAATVAAAALGVAISSAMSGAPVSPESATKMAQSQVETAARKKARERAGVQKVMERIEEAGPVGEAAREVQRYQLSERAEKATVEKEERLHMDAATRKAMREERACLAASRRNIADARVFCGLSRKSSPYDWPSTPPPIQGAPEGSEGAALAAQDPLLRRAKGLVSASSQVMAALDQQNEMLRRKAAGLASASQLSMPRAAPQPQPQRVPLGAGAAARASTKAEEEAALLAKAKELLADYKPPGSEKRPGVPSHVTRRKEAPLEATLELQLETGGRRRPR